MEESLNTKAGQKIRLMRKMLGLSQTDLARSLDISYQQLQKYESGKNNLSLNMLAKIGGALGTDPKTLIEEDDQSYTMASKGSSLNLLQKIDALEDPAVRKSLIKLIETLKHSQ